MIWYFIAYLAVFLAEAVTSWMYLEYLFQKKGSRLRCAVSFALGYSFLFCLIPLESTLINAVAFAIVNGIIILSSYQCSLGRALLNTGFLTFVMLASEVLMALLLNVAVHDFSAYTYRISVWTALAILSKLLYFFVILIGAHIFRKRGNQFAEEKGGTLLLCVLPLSSVLVVVTLIYVGIRIRQDSFLETLMLFSMILLLFVNILVLVVYNRMQKLAAERTAMQVELERETAQVEYYTLIKDQFERQRELIHDIRHHIQTISGLSAKENEGAVFQYVKQMAEDPALSRQVIYCSNPVINVIIVRYEEQCSKLGIRFECDIREHCLERLSAQDASIIFHNILSNAVEAASASADKHMELSVFFRTEQSADVITLTNSCDTTPKERKDGLLETHKRDKSLHGIGLRSVRRAVKRYGGAMVLHFEESQKQFFVTISIPK